MNILDLLLSRRGNARDEQSPSEREPTGGRVRRGGLSGLVTASPSVEESISVVLRRQVPVRFGEEAGSYLGGRPRLPAGTGWPRAETGLPLHFIAQVDCASLPTELWGGLGPRSGWLLLFVDIEAIDDQEDRPLGKVLHVDALGPEASPPAELYLARRNVLDLSRLPDASANRQRRHFRKWPVDLVTTSADTSEITGSNLYGAPEDDLIQIALDGRPLDRPLTWGGVYMVLAALVLAYDIDKSAEDWERRSSALFDYPEPDASNFNKEWQERRDQLPERIEFGYHSPQFTAADERLKVQMYEERRKGWTRRAFKVLDEETARSLEFLNDHREKLAAALSAGNEGEALETLRQRVEYYQEQVAEREEHRAYLTDLFAQFPSEEALTEEIGRTGHALKDWARQSHQRLRALLDLVAPIDPDTPLSGQDWADLCAEIASMKGAYWTKTHGTDVLRKVEREIAFRIDDVVREEVLDRYAAQQAPANGLKPELIASIEPGLRHLECQMPHKLGGLINSVYDEPLKRSHVLLFQMASDEAVGWIFGDLGFFYVSIHHDDLAAGRFDRINAWFEA